jgi:hypothetical protein
MNNWNRMCNQIDKKRFYPRTSPWIAPLDENFESRDSVDVQSSEFSNSGAKTYSSTDAFSGKEIIKQVRKKKSKKSKKDRIIEKVIDISARSKTERV